MTSHDFLRINIVRFYNEWAEIIIVLERTFSRKKLLQYQQRYSVPFGKTEQRGLMVIKTSTKTRARRSKAAIACWKRMTGQIVSLIRATKDQANPQLTYSNFPASSSDTQRRCSTARSVQDEEGLASATSQVAWLADLNVGQRLSPVLPRPATRPPADGHRVSTVRERGGHGEGQAISGGCRAARDDGPTSSNRSPVLFAGGSNRVLPVNSDVTQNVDPQGRRRHRRARKKCRRHHHQQEQTLVNSFTITIGHVSTDVETSSLAVPSL